ncbi:cytochrome P450 [Wolfiporia cocos MD-104 SS10]|uniref:Cytochrome P450 n=1 Tax=Wolfiporia cocos (strain MD-104) TaxID=742152 RepID=A0A2H3JJI8_WOLCO|nr:cytochrome P450 [Wolfiporia cocos MD-104 SS10]
MLSPILYTACLGTIWAALYFSSKRRRSLPPGPPGYPIIGNTLQIPEDRQWITFAEWGRKYGKIMYISALGQDTIILSSPDVVTELLENRGSMYSDRPTYHMAGELVGYGDTIVLLPNGNRLRASRKLVANALTKRDSAVLAGIYEDKVLNFLSRLLETPKEFSEHIQLLVASAVLQISHGYNVRNVNDDFLRIARRANHEYHMSIAPGAWLVELIPQSDGYGRDLAVRYIPDWVPGAGFKRKARNWRKTVEWLKNVPYDTVKMGAPQRASQSPSHFFSVPCNTYVRLPFL